MLLNLILQVPTVTDSTAALGAQSINYFSLLMKGGVVIYPILALLLITLFLATERYLFIKENSRIDTGFLRSLKDNILRGDIRTASTLCKGTNRPISRILEKGISRVGKPVKDIESAMEIQSNLEISKMEKNMGYLGLIAGVAPTLGFVGTISIKALIVFVDKDSLYKAAQIMHYEDARIFHSFGLKKTVSLENSITLTRRTAKVLQELMPEFQQRNYNKYFIKYPKFQLMQDHTGKYGTDILMRECRIQLRRSVKHETTLDLINYSVLKTPDEVLLYFVYCVMHYKEQLDKCYKLLP